jgi:hypothetical protein
MADQTFGTFGFATELLDIAIWHFLEKRSFRSVLTAAGTAEEIFGKALSNWGEQNFLDWKYETFQPLRTILRGKPLSKKDFIRGQNRALVAARSPEPSVVLDLEDAALWMIVRACFNSDRLGLPRTARMREFQDWFDEHVVGQGEKQLYDDVVGVDFP